jgi:hypothetical protein
MLNKNCSCIICKKEFPTKGISTHYERAHVGKIKYSSGNNGKYAQISQNAAVKRQHKEDDYYKNPSVCLECGVTHSYSNRKSKFCCKSCAAKFENKRRKDIKWTPSAEQRIKTSEKLTGKTYSPPVLIQVNCEECGCLFEFVQHYSKRQKRFCSRSCSTKHGNKERYAKAREMRTALENYRADCAFKFNLSDFPDEFDFALIETHGWYKPKNRGNNLFGVSRDHAVSVRYGFDNNLPAEHLAHPANCVLMRHGENVSKYTSNSMSYDDLLDRITKWDIKYKQKC